ncbi:MAG: cell division protein FtsQ, partial [Brevundimonas sp.]
MPAVVRGGRRQGSTKGKGPQKGSRNAPATPGKVAAIGRLDLSPRAVLISIVAGVVVLGGVLATGARAERISNSVSTKFDNITSGMGLK